MLSFPVSFSLSETSRFFAKFAPKIFFAAIASRKFSCANFGFQARWRLDRFFRGKWCPFPYRAHLSFSRGPFLRADSAFFLGGFPVALFAPKCPWFSPPLLFLSSSLSPLGAGPGLLSLFSASARQDLPARGRSCTACCCSFLSLFLSLSLSLSARAGSPLPLPLSPSLFLSSFFLSCMHSDTCKTRSQFRESLRELLRELRWSFCSSRGMPFREGNFVFREWNFEVRELPRMEFCSGTRSGII